jgi:hypothetical protein
MTVKERALAWIQGMETPGGPLHSGAATYKYIAVESYEHGYREAMNRAQEMLIEIVRDKGPILPSSIVVQFIDAVSLEVK